MNYDDGDDFQVPPEKDGSYWVYPDLEVSFADRSTVSIMIDAMEDAELRMLSDLRGRFSGSVSIHAQRYIEALATEVLRLRGK